MRAELAEFEKRLSEQECRIRYNLAVGDLRRLARIGTLKEESIGAELHKDLIAPTESARRKSEYSASIIEAYAAWEAYIENIIQAYIDECISGETSHRNAICSQHLKATLEVLASIEKGAPRYKDLSVVDLLECATAVESGLYDRVNSAALVHHVANLRSKTVRELLARIGAAEIWANVADDPSLKKGLQNIGLHPAVDYAFFFVDDLCERRNEIAHGGDPQQLFDPEIQLTYVKGLRLIGRKLFEKLYLHAFESSSTNYAIVGSYNKKSQRQVAVIRAIDGATIEVGDNCIIVNNSTGLRSMRKVVSMQLDGADVRHAQATEDGFEIGAKFDESIHKAGTVYVRCT